MAVSGKRKVWSIIILFVGVGGVGKMKKRRKLKSKNISNKLSVIIIARNEEKKIEDCIKSVKWADEIVVIDNASNDKTVKVAKKLGARVFDGKKEWILNYSALRNLGKKKVKGNWIFYVDADERVTFELKNEIQNILKIHLSETIGLKKKLATSGYSAYAIPRKNIILGREMKYGGWYPDYVKRLFLKEDLRKWEGKLHEEPVFEGYMKHLKEHLIHIKHDNLEEMVEKTNKWSVLEAKMLYDSGHPKMAWWRFIRIMLTELWIRLIKNKGFMDGPEGVIYSFYQMWSKFITYAKLWELQLVGESKSIQKKK